MQVLRGVGAGAVHLHPAGQRLRPEHHVPVHRDAVRVVQRVERQQRLRQNGNIQVNTGRMGIQVNTGRMGIQVNTGRMGIQVNTGGMGIQVNTGRMGIQVQVEWVYR